MKYKKLVIMVSLFVVIALTSITFKLVQATSNQIVNATIKISVCGNNVAENGEDCDNADLAGKTCSDLGFTSGNLQCDIACSFNSSSCTNPVTTVVYSQISQLLTNGVFTIPTGSSSTSTTSVSNQQQVVIKASASDNTDKVIIPQGIVIAKKDGTNFSVIALTLQNIQVNSLSGYTTDLVIDKAIQWGLSSSELNFSSAIAVNIYVGSAFEGQTLGVMRSTTGASGWTTDGIVAPYTCTVTSGMCSFQTTKASYFAANHNSSTSSSSLSSNNSVSTVSTETSACRDQTPGIKAPWLYGAINQNSNSILLYFTEADNPVNKYVLEYGVSPGNYQYGVQDLGINLRSQMTFLVKSLSPDTTYYFRIRGGNGCATGTWSNEISAKTKGLVSFNQLDITKSELKPNPIDKIEVQDNYDLKVKIVDTNKKPVEGAKVTIYSKVQEEITDKDGIAEFKNVEKGDHKVLVVYNNFEGEQSINLTGNIKSFNLIVTVQQKAISLPPPAFEIVGVMGVVIVCLMIIIIKKRQKNS